MFRFIETIKYMNGTFYHLAWHQKRVNRTFKHFFPKSKPFDLNEIVHRCQVDSKGLYKIRILYNEKRFQIEALSYQRKKTHSIHFQEITFDYDYKFIDRESINSFVNKVENDEVIFTRNGKLLDSSYANLALFDNNEWCTPHTYLLNGTTRQRLIYEGKLIEKEIVISDLKNFEKISFINALNDIGENVFDFNCYI